MSWRRGELGLYDCRERSVLMKVFLSFIAGFVLGFCAGVWFLCRLAG